MIGLDTKIEYLVGVGPKMAEKFHRLGIGTVEDLFWYYPRRYNDYTRPKRISDLINGHPEFISGSLCNGDGMLKQVQHDDKVTIRGKIVSVENKRTSRRRFTVTEAMVMDGTGELKVVWFNQPFLKKMLAPGRELILNGKINYNYYSHEFVMESPTRAVKPMIVPIYGETEGLSSGYVRKIVSSIKYLVSSVEEWLPQALLANSKRGVIPAEAGIQSIGIASGSQVAGRNDKNDELDSNRAIEQYNNLNLLPIEEAVLQIHFPKNSEKLAQAQRRLAFDELFIIALQADMAKEQLRREVAPVLMVDGRWSTVDGFIAGLPFELTGDQRRAVDTILKDLAQNKPMNRLLNGDVGSGKTVVAAVAALAAVKAGYRVAVMAPTEILAGQHFRTFCELFGKEDISIGLWTANSKLSSIKYQLSNNNQLKNDQLIENCKLKIVNSDLAKCQILIGTQALIQKDVELENIGLVIVDEQHRFGVEQRAKLQQLSSISPSLSARRAGGNDQISINNQGSSKKAIDNLKIDELNDHCKLKIENSKKVRSHFLSMTATPIPRTLSLALFGDLDVSIIREKPADRKEIKTRLVEEFNRAKAYEFIRKHIKAGRQAFVVCPLIEDKIDQNSKFETLNPKQALNINEENSKPPAAQDDNFNGLFEDERKTVKREFEKLKRIFPEYKIAMLHGRMKSKEKDAVMAEFVANKVNILVSTSVVEVGVDVPNASVMMIEDAERFGLAALHQFRGRVGRADHQSFCLLFSSTMNQKAFKRLKAMEDVSDGFKLAEIDLETRGPGAVFGTEQSGLLDLRMASLSDAALISEASEAAKGIIKSDPELKDYPLLKNKVAEYLSHKHLE